MPLTDRDRDLLRFEAQWQRHGAAKEEAVRDRLGITPARYYQLLSRVIDTEDALIFDPMLVHRLRRRRDESDREQRRRLAPARRSSAAPTGLSAEGR